MSLFLSEKERAFPEMNFVGLVGDGYHQAGLLEEFFTRAAPWARWSWRRPETLLDGLSSADAVVISTENRLNPPAAEPLWMSEAVENGLERFVDEGGGLLVFHSGMASYPQNGPYSKLAGGSFQFYPVEHPKFRFFSTQAHPITEGIEPFELTDEQYFVRRELSTTELGRVESPMFGGSSALWCQVRGKGRVVGLTPGHTPESLNHPMLLRLAGQSLEWAVGRRA
jgi:type 1 glutamine amidotransferase